MVGFFVGVVEGFCVCFLVGNALLSDNLGSPQIGISLRQSQKQIFWLLIRVLLTQEAGK